MLTIAAVPVLAFSNVDPPDTEVRRVAPVVVVDDVAPITSSPTPPVTTPPSAAAATTAPTTPVPSTAPAVTAAAAAGPAIGPASVAEMEGEFAPTWTLPRVVRVLTPQLDDNPPPTTTTTTTTAPRRTTTTRPPAPTTTAPPTTTTPPTTTAPPTTRAPTTTAPPTGTIFGQPYKSTWPTLAMWLQIAQCESGSRWTITGRYYGGLQFSLGSWGWVGGTGLPSDASQDEQIYRANLLWERQGWSGWPGCSAKAGWSRWQTTP